MPFGRGDGQISEILLAARGNRWAFPASIALEYPVPPGSDPVQEVKHCVEWEGAPGGEYLHHAVDPQHPNTLYSGKLIRTDYSSRQLQF